MTYARARLWLGISGVGAWVLLASAGIVWRWGDTLGERSTAFFFATCILTYVALQAPFDWLGGLYLPGRYGRPTVSLAAWLRGAAVQGIVFWLSSMIVFAAGQRAGIAGAAGALVAFMLVLLIGQPWVAWCVGLLRIDGDAASTLLVHAKDPSFVGGWAGIGPTRKLLVPAGWRPEWREVQYVRREGVIRQGTRIAGLLVALGFNTAGLAVSYALTPGAGFGSTGEFLHLVFGFTLWSFAGLLLLPSISRPAVLLADRYAESHGIAWLETARELDKLQEDEPARSEWIERIFHPVPSLYARGKQPRPRWGAWHAARLALYLSWAAPGLLSRAVHCNVGRPDLWVMFPGD